MAAEALFEVDGDRYVPTQYTAGPWSPELQHAGPPSALLARCLREKIEGSDPFMLARATFDILRPVPIAPLTVQTRTLRPGRRVQQLEATLRLAADGTELMRGTAWVLRESPLAPAPAPDAAPAPPDACTPTTLPWWEEDVAYHAALEWRLASGSVTEPGPACVWTRLRMPLVAGEEPTPLQHLLVMGDAASGVSWELDWATHTFPNVDFSVHLERPPAGEWLAMDARTRLGPRGTAQCVAVLHDRDGRVGISTQTLLVGQRP